MPAGTFRSRKVSLWPWVICGLGAMFYCYEYFLRITPSVMTSELMSTYNLKGAEVGNLSAFYYHAYVPMQIIVGLLMDRYGPRRLLTIACLFCALGTYLFAGHYGFGFAELGRFLVGFGSAFAFVGALKIATIWLPPNRFALVSGIIMCLGMIGAMIGDILLRKLVDAISWQSTIYVSAIAGVVLSVVLWTFIRDSSPEFPEHHSHNINFKDVLSGLWETVKNSQIWLCGMVGFLLYLSLSAFAELWGIPYLEQAQHFSKNYAAYANSMIFLGWAVGSPIWGWISDHAQRRCLPIIIGSIGSLVLVSILLYLPGLTFNLVYLILFCFGFFSSAQILIFAICHEASSLKVAGTAIALTNMIVMIGGNVFQPLIGRLLDQDWVGAMKHGARVYPLHAYHMALSVLPICFFAAIILMFFIRETNCMVKIED
jgi:sugar phosphate permease